MKRLFFIILSVQLLLSCTEKKEAVDSMEVSWEQALNDWEIRSEICLKANYWY
jgi:hypothetical protein|tara:strand:- start:192 stop:350 length:159 start_codon:yes stop_codon:yes gene_type:complete